MIPWWTLPAILELLVIMTAGFIWRNTSDWMGGPLWALATFIVGTGAVLPIASVCMFISFFL